MTKVGLPFKSLPKKKKAPLQHRICPDCKKGALITLTTFTARGHQRNG